MTKPKSVYLADPAQRHGVHHLSTADMCRRYHCGPSTLTRRRKDDPDFPKPVQFGGVSSPLLYREDECDRYDALRREAAVPQPPRPLPSGAFKQREALADNTGTDTVASAGRDLPASQKLIGRPQAAESRRRSQPMKAVIRDWIVINGQIVDTTAGGGFEFFGPFTEAEAEQVRQSLQGPEHTTIAIQLLKLASRGSGIDAE